MARAQVGVKLAQYRLADTVEKLRAGPGLLVDTKEEQFQHH